MTQTEVIHPTSAAAQPPSFAADIVSQPPSTFDEADLQPALRPDPPNGGSGWLTKALALVAVFAIGVVVGVVADRQFGSPGSEQSPGGNQQGNFPGGAPGGFPGGGQGTFPGGGQGGPPTGGTGTAPGGTGTAPGGATTTDT